MSRPLPRYREEEISDPIDKLIAQRRREKERATQRVNDGHDIGDPAELRGIPVIAHGVGGTSPGSSPHTEAASGRLDRHRIMNP